MNWKTGRNSWKQDIRKYEYAMGILKATAAVAVMLYVFYDSLIPAPLLVPVWLIYIRDWQIDLSRKKEHELRLQFRDSIQVMASALKAGYSVENAIREAGRELSPAYPEGASEKKEFPRIVRQMDLNIPAEEDLPEVSGRYRTGSLDTF